MPPQTTEDTMGSFKEVNTEMGTVTGMTVEEEQAMFKRVFEKMMARRAKRRAKREEASDNKGDALPQP